MSEPHLTVILPAAGQSARFGTGASKLFEQIAGRAVIAHTIDAFIHRPDVRQIVIASSDPPALSARLSTMGPYDDYIHHRKIQIVPGGTNRAESVRAALHAAKDAQWVAVHDAARPLVSQELISRTSTAAGKHGAAAPAMAVPWTIKQATGPLPAKVIQTLARQTLWAMQTPQIMPAPMLNAAFASCPTPLDQITDDVQLLELAGHEVWLVPGEEQNLKITTPIDLHIAEFWLNKRT